MTDYEDGLEGLREFMHHRRYRANETDNEYFQALLDDSLRYVEQGKDLKDSYGRLVTVARLTVDTLSTMTWKCRNKVALDEFQVYRRRVNSYDYEDEDLMRSYERLRDIFEKVLFSSTYFGFSEYLVETRSERPLREGRTVHHG